MFVDPEFDSVAAMLWASTKYESGHRPARGLQRRFEISLDVACSHQKSGCGLRLEGVFQRRLHHLIEARVVVMEERAVAHHSLGLRSVKSNRMRPGFW